MNIKKHAKFSASGAHRWLNCAAFVNLAELVPPSPDNKYSIEGTRAHACLEKYMSSGLSVNLLKEYGEEMVAHAKKATLDILNISQYDPTQKTHCLLVEEKMDLKFLDSEAGGTVDAAVVEEYGTLYVFDYKYGQGIMVDPKENEQMILYALGIAHKYSYNFSRVVLVILQPRAKTGDTVKMWETSVDELLEWGKRFKKAIIQANAVNPKSTPGDWCKWCPAAAVCPAIGHAALTKARHDFPSALTTTSVQNLGKTLKEINKVKIWIKAVEKLAFEELSRGREVEGFKLVPKRGIRKWANPLIAIREAARAFGDDAFTSQLKSPAQLSKIDKHTIDFVKKHSVSISSGMTVVPDTDKRKSINYIDIDFADDFLEGDFSDDKNEIT